MTTDSLRIFVIIDIKFVRFPAKATPVRTIAKKFPTTSPVVDTHVEAMAINANMLKNVAIPSIVATRVRGAPKLSANIPKNVNVREKALRITPGTVLPLLGEAII